LGAIFLAAIASSCALITLLSLEPLPVLPEDMRSAASTIGQMLIQLVTVVGALALIIGVLNLIIVHIGKLSATPTSAVYSGITLLTFIALVVVHVLQRLGILRVGNATESPLLTLTLMDTIQVVIESALAGLLFFFLVFAAYRMMRRRVTVWGLLFVATLIIVLVTAFAEGNTLAANVRDFILRVPVGAGTRGLLIGIAIGTVVVGARVLIGQDRVFRE
jgi:hypothetical protein